MTCELSCSVEAYKTVQGLHFSPVNGARPRLSATQVFPDPGSPEIMARVPEASLSCQSHSTGRTWRSERYTKSALLSLAAGSAGIWCGGASPGKSCCGPRASATTVVLGGGSIEEEISGRGVKARPERTDIRAFGLLIGTRTLRIWHSYHHGFICATA
jgi:hypothetical protein